MYTLDTPRLDKANFIPVPGIHVWYPPKTKFVMSDRIYITQENGEFRMLPLGNGNPRRNKVLWKRILRRQGVTIGQ